jgi:hypothetical protein
MASRVRTMWSCKDFTQLAMRIRIGFCDISMRHAARQGVTTHSGIILLLGVDRHPRTTMRIHDSERWCPITLDIGLHLASASALYLHETFRSKMRAHRLGLGGPAPGEHEDQASSETCRCGGDKRVWPSWRLRRRWRWW